jgi:hypothetical protein
MLRELACYICATTIVFKSLHDQEGEWFNSSVLLDTSVEPRDIFFSEYAVMGNEVDYGLKNQIEIDPLWKEEDRK